MPKKDDNTPRIVGAIGGEKGRIFREGDEDAFRVAHAGKDFQPLIDRGVITGDWSTPAEVEVPQEPPKTGAGGKTGAATGTGAAGGAGGGQK